MAEPSERSIFLNALEQPTSADRAAYLDQACGEDAGVRREVEALLAAHDRLPSASAADPLDPPTFLTPPGTVIGRYKVLQPIGEGGYGTVFMAEQTTPVHRKVALKIVKPGMDTRQVIARFEAERQALALMDHPNIARVFDAGVTDTGRPYFVMELVNGTPITKHCDEHKLTPRARLELFVQVCHAVQHAHQKGIIHRDLKPSNVLVARYDGRAVPKVIDFGVAKAMGQRLTESTMFTGLGDVIGTPQYMSPEQAELNPLDIDTRSDVYSLGVILYELLTGTTPLESRRIREVALLEVLRVIREEEAPRPSTRLTTTSAELPGIAAQRGLEPKSLSGVVRGELDWIVMRALEKDRGRRYETATGLASDVKRYLADEPVSACPPSARYRLQKFVRRNKAAVVTAALVILTLICGIAGTSFGLVRAERSRRAEVERAEGERQARQHAQDREAETNAVLNYVEQKIFAAARPEGVGPGLGPEMTLRQAIEIALPELDSAFPDRPLIEARLRRTLAASFSYLGETKTALEQREKALALYAKHLGPDHAATFNTRFDLASTYGSLGRHAEAVKILEDSLTRYRAEGGTDHADTLTCMNNLAGCYARLGRHDDAIRLHEEALALRKAKFGPTHRESLISMLNLAAARSMAGRKAEALALLEEALPLARAAWGPEHPQTLNFMNNLATSYAGFKRYAEAAKLSESLIAPAQAKLGRDHPTTLLYMKNLGEAYRLAGRHDESLQVLVEALDLMKNKFGLDDPRTLACRSSVSIGYQRAGRFADAARVSEESLALRKTKFGVDSAEVQGTLKSLAKSYAALGRHDEARKRRDEVLSIQRRAYRRQPGDASAGVSPGAELARTLNTFSWDLVIGADLKTRDPESAVEMAREAVELEPENSNYRDTLGVAQYRTGDWAAAVASLKKCRELRQGKGGREYNTPFFLAMALWQSGDPVEARRMYAIAVAWMNENAPRDDLLIRCRDEAAALIGVSESK